MWESEEVSQLHSDFPLHARLTGEPLAGSNLSVAQNHRLIGRSRTEGTLGALHAYSTCATAALTTAIGRQVNLMRPRNRKQGVPRFDAKLDGLASAGR